MPTEAPSPRRWYHQYKIEAVLLGLFAVLGVGGPLCMSYAEFLGGTENKPGGFLAFMGIPVLFILASIVFIASTIIRFFRPPRTLKHMLLRVAFLIAPPALLVGGFLVTVPMAPTFLRGFERWVLKEVDIDAIQQWLATEGLKYADKEVLVRDELPEFLTRFKTGIAVRDLPSGGGPCVEFQWGGPLEHWGLVVGLPDMPAPEEGAIDVSDSETEFRRPIKPGVYIYDRG